MPGRHRSIKNPKVYQALKRKGYSKSSAAAISNAQVGRSRRGGKRRKGR